MNIVDEGGRTHERLIGTLGPFVVKEPRALSKLFGLQILLENQNVATG